jgi:hypothetical protein
MLATELVERVAEDMEASSFSYQFTPFPASSVSRLPHETLPLQILRYVNRGSGRNQDGQVRLQNAVITRDQTLADIGGDKLRFVPEHAIEGNHLVINMSECPNICMYNCIHH